LKETLKFQDVSILQMKHKEILIYECFIIFKSKSEFETLKMIECHQGIPTLKCREKGEMKELKSKQIDLKVQTSKEEKIEIKSKSKSLDKIFEEFGMNIENELLNDFIMNKKEFQCSKDLIILKNEQSFNVKENFKNEILNIGLKEIKKGNFQNFLNEKEEKKEKIFEFFIPNVNILSNSTE
jgi:hypothetical protein